MKESNSVAEQYRQVQVETSTTLELVRLAYDGIIDHLVQAVEALQSSTKSYDFVNEKLTKAQEIVFALEDGLDDSEGELASVLAQFYTFVRKKLIECNLNQSLDDLKDIIALVEQVRDYWQASVEESVEIPTSIDSDKRQNVDVVN